MKQSPLCNVINWYNFKRRGLSHGNNFHTHGLIHIHGKGPIEVGNNVSIISGTKYNSSTGDGATHFRVWGKAKLVIKDGAGISNSAISVREYVEIGEGVAIGSGCVIMDLDFHPIDPADKGVLDDLGKSAPFIIKKEAFIGARSMILKGVTIGERAVVGAGSVVTRDIPDGEVWAGNPAMFVRKIRE